MRTRAEQQSPSCRGRKAAPSAAESAMATWLVKVRRAGGVALVCAAALDSSLSLTFLDHEDDTMAPTIVPNQTEGYFFFNNIYFLLNNMDQRCIILGTNGSWRDCSINDLVVVRWVSHLSI
jgi:hypothetical protein